MVVDERSLSAPSMFIFWVSCILQYSSMVAALFFLWKESFVGFLLFCFGAYLPNTIAQKLDRPTQRFQDECQASAPQYATALCKVAAFLFKVAFFLFTFVFFQRGIPGGYFYKGFLGGYALFVLTCALRDIYLASYCIKHWHERHR
jgi:hypothetical protein